MIGNSLEEGLMTWIGHPGHLGAEKLAALAGLTVCVAVWLFVGGWGGFFLGPLAGLGLGGWLFRRLEHRRVDARAAEAEARRAAHEREVQAGIAALRRAGEGRT